MDKVAVGVLTVSDRCSANEAIDESGRNLVKMIGEGLVENGTVTKIDVVSDNKEEIEMKLREWSESGLDVILTTGGTGLSARDVTPEATLEVCKKIIPGISWQMMQRSLSITPLGALSRSVAGYLGKTLIINLPGSKKGSRECLEAVADVIPHAVHVIAGKTVEIQRVHDFSHGKKSSVKIDNVAKRKTESPYDLVNVKRAQEIIMERVHLLRKDSFVRYEKAHCCVLAQDLAARENHPPFDASLKDGYAVLSTDKSLERIVIGVSNAGSSPPQQKILTNHCMRIGTGAALPPGADAVVQVEDTELKTLPRENHDLKQEVITLKVLPKKGQDIRPKGSDFKMGHILMRSGTYLDSAGVGLLAASGIVNVRVFEKPLVAVISTGDELANPDEQLSPGKVRDSNRITLLNLLKEENVPGLDLGKVRDNPDALLNVLESAFQRADVVVTTGSMSMGERDYLKEVLVSDFNAEICFGRVLMKPGKPTAFGILMFEGKPKLWFGLPGNPASALVTAHLFLLPALRSISGLETVFPVGVTAVLKEKPVLEDRPQYARGVLSYDADSNVWMAEILQNQSSSRIGSCVNVNCLVELPTSDDSSKPHGPETGSNSTETPNQHFQSNFGSTGTSNKRFQSNFGFTGTSNQPFQSNFGSTGTSNQHFQSNFGSTGTSNQRFQSNFGFTGISNQHSHGVFNFKGTSNQQNSLFRVTARAFMIGKILRA